MLEKIEQITYTKEIEIPTVSKNNLILLQIYTFV